MNKTNGPGKRCETNVENQWKNIQNLAFNLIFNNQSLILPLHPLKKCFLKIILAATIFRINNSFLSFFKRSNTDIFDALTSNGPGRDFRKFVEPNWALASVRLTHCKTLFVVQIRYKYWSELSLQSYFSVCVAREDLQEMSLAVKKWGSVNCKSMLQRRWSLYNFSLVSY